MLEILFFPVVLLASLPGTAFIPAIIFSALYVNKRKRIPKFSRILTIAVILVWAIYGVYETGMYFWMKTVIAPIRVDLLLIVPILYFVTLVGTIALMQTKRPNIVKNRKIKPGIKLLEEKEGIGDEAKQGDIVKVRLNGWLHQGTQIQTNYIENIRMGNRNIIPGIEYSIEGMKTSGKRKVQISPHLGYGKQGVKDLIPSNAVLIYEIEVLDIQPDS